jgi:hypothetical protein
VTANRLGIRCDPGLCYVALTSLDEPADARMVAQATSGYYAGNDDRLVTTGPAEAWEGPVKFGDVGPDRS